MVHRKRQKPNLCVKGCEGQHRESEQNQGKERQSCPHFSAPHIGNAQHEGRIGSTRPANIRLVNVRFL